MPFGEGYPGIAPHLRLDAIGQEGFVAVGERGVEAAAASYAAFADSAAPTFEVAVDRPFLWFVHETPGVVLFAGSVADPR